MAETLIACHRADRAFADRLVRALADLKIKTRRRIDDSALAKKDPRLAPESALIVIWSKHSSASAPFGHLANRAAANGQLHLVCVDDSGLSPRLQGVAHHDLAEWSGDLRHSGFVGLWRGLAAQLGLRHLADRAPVMSVIVKNRPRAANAEALAGAPTRSDVQQQRKSDDEDAFEITSPRDLRARTARRAPIVMGAAALLAAGAAFLFLVHPHLAPRAGSAADARGQDSSREEFQRTPQATHLQTAQPDASGEIQKTQPDASPEALARRPARGRGATNVTPAATSLASLSPALLRQRVLAAPGESQLFLLAPQLRENVERARGAALRAADVAERAMARPTSDVLVTQINSRSAYAGEWSNDAANGVGTSRDSDGTEYAGSWRDSRWHGRGVVIYANNARYEGEFVGGAPTGRGVFWDASGRRLARADFPAAPTSKGP